jgi:hypothetical protein
MLGAELYAKRLTGAIPKPGKDTIVSNYLYLSQKLADATPTERTAMIMLMKKSSIITWRHINLLGEYDFSDERLSTITPFQLPKILELKVL